MESPDEDRLFAAPLDQFTGLRDALARELSAAGRAEEASRAKALRKPSISAWAVNQVARRHPDELADLFAAGDRVLEAQARALTGKGSADLREALAGERRAVAALIERGRAILVEAGHAAAQQHLDRIGRTLAAAAHEADKREIVRAGRLTSDLEPAGFETLAGLVPDVADAAPPREDRARAKRRKELSRRAEQLAAAAEEAEAAARLRREEADRAERASQEAHAEAVSAADAARRARDEAREAARAADQA